MFEDQLDDFQETLDALVAISGYQLEKLNRVSSSHESFFDRHEKTRETVTQILKDMAEQEECLAKNLVDLEAKKNLNELESLQEELTQCKIKNETLDSELELLQRELDKLRKQEDELTAMETEMEEDTTEVIPSTLHVVKLYQLITKIKWDVDTDAPILKGVHYGQDLVTPINIDTTGKTRREIAEELWSLVSTEWGKK
ncbi:kinetochore protein Spc24 isoform X2 [Corythoichthys intestinalis]|nr:kinetochore protein Spc24 isoform X2 [Corythoichthys intestinalis]XP_057673021.1 kinetochore protein Spc24 isoform X2 [Corythoichthys intestinalis]XP_061805055.1 kinetochore protein Spc24-like [Nerophis lumbriciformis]